MRPARTTLLLALALALAAGVGRAESPSAEYQVKAAVLFQATQFVEWPDEAFDAADAPILIGVLGEDPFGPLLDQAVKGQTKKGRPLQVRRYRTLDDLGGCHLLFVSHSEKDHVGEVLKRLEEPALKRKSTLTVSEEEAFAQQGGILQFDIQERKIRMQINVDAAARAKIRISSQLLKLATIVKEAEREKAGSFLPETGHDRRIETAGRPGGPRDVRGGTGARDHAG
jgi:hypothetical protein